MRPSRLVPAALFAVALIGLAVPANAASAPAISSSRPRPSLRDQATRYRPSGRLEVKFEDGVSRVAQDAAFARVTSQGLSLRVDRRSASLNAALLSVHDAAAVQAVLRSDRAVEFVEMESRYTPYAETPSRELVEVGADTVQASGNVGAGTEIAVIDSPVDATNPDLDGPGKVVDAGYVTADDPDDSTDVACTTVTCPHGTAVATAAAAEADTADVSSTNMLGVAPGAVIRSYNVFRVYTYPNTDPAPAPGDPTEFKVVQASSFDIAQALTDLATYASTHPALVAANMSLGSSFDSDLIKSALGTLHSSAPQVTVVVAAGNDGGERANFPAGDPYVISVGATGQIPLSSPCSTVVDPATAWTVTDFSNRGDVDVVAPGRCVSVWFPTQQADLSYNTDAAVRNENGTSFAAPIVAGVVALLAADPTTPVTGDAARAAILAGADHTGSDVNRGLGAVKAPAALDLANGPDAYTALTVVRGAQVATAVGRRKVEAIRVEPGNTTTPTAEATLTVQSGFGALSPVSSTVVNGLATTIKSFAVPVLNKAGQGFTITATGATVAASDTSVRHLLMLDSGDSFEGVPAANGEAASLNLTWGSRSANIRSAYLSSGTLDWTFTYNANSPVGGPDVYVWMPSSAGETADAASEPVAVGGETGIGPYTHHTTVGTTNCGVTCVNGRYLVGWLLSSSDDDSDPSDPSTRYGLKLGYPGPTATLSTPVIASSVSTTGPFTVSWGGTSAATFDVSYTTKKKVGSSWVLAPWTPWKTATATHSAVFGASNLPVKVVPGQTYHFLVRSWDTHGNPSLPTTKYTSAPVDDRYAYLAYSAGWAGYNVAGHWLGTLHQTGTAGAKVSLTSETQRLTVIGDRCTACGQFRVYIDGVYKVTVDTRWSSTLKERVLWTSALFSSIKSHKISIVAVGTAGRPKIVIDGIGTLR